MLESDSGVFRPTGFGFTGSDAARAKVKEIATLLRGIQADRIGPAGDGADIGPSVQAADIPAMSLEVEGNYFLIHHTPADTIDKIDPMDIARASAAIAVMTYVIAEMPERLTLELPACSFSPAASVPQTDWSWKRGSWSLLDRVDQIVGALAVVVAGRDRVEVLDRHDRDDGDAAAVEPAADALGGAGAEVAVERAGEVDDRARAAVLLSRPPRRSTPPSSRPSRTAPSSTVPWPRLPRSPPASGFWMAAHLLGEPVEVGDRAGTGDRAPRASGRRLTSASTAVRPDFATSAAIRRGTLAATTGQPCALAISTSAR